MTLWQIVKKELRRMFIEEPKTALLLLGIPIVYSLLFGVVYQENAVKYMPTVVYDQDQSQLSRKLGQAFGDSERYDIVAYVDSQEELEEYLREGRAKVAVAIPVHFARDVKRGMGSEVLVQVDGSNLLFANSVVSSAQEIVQTFSAGVGMNLIEAIGQMPDEALNKAAPIQFGVRILNNPTFAYSHFILAGLGANGLQIGIMLAICTALNREYKRLEDWRGVSSRRLIIGKLLPYWALGVVAFAVYMLIIVYGFDLPFKGSVASVLMSGTAFVLAVVGVGGFFSAVAPNEVYAVQLPMVYIMPALLFSGYVWPHLAMNEISLMLSKLLPLTYMADDVRDLMLNGYAPFLQNNVMILLMFGLGLLAISTLIFSWRRSRYEQT
ncbi:putative multidrug ABC transporter permease YbhR [bioreactor metagenome]|uniref:Putative multidrug ABC transporter permease YbhR n=1 Tax=bioreactor metagenome TaxID=1076179 RepID=A0A644SVU6_9ZZZZ|nr:ABC transporter permease [Negativicutes bacterium]